ncbi:MAG: c-type cytochrome domain-containing protein [Planctomycetota bacterium]
MADSTNLPQLLALAPILAEAGPDLGRAFGRLHPVVVHFPIAVGLVAVGAEWWRSLSRREGMSPLTVPLLAISAVTAVAATATGWVIAAREYGGEDSDTLGFHRWLGTATAVAMVLLAWRGAALARDLSRNGGAAAVARLGAFRVWALAVGIAVAFTGHLGGALVHGENYLGEVLFPPSKREEAPKDASAAETVALSPADEFFLREVRPIFEAHCFECHGPRKQKGGLRMDTKAWLFNGDAEEWTVLPGPGAESKLHIRVALDRADPDAMPPEGDGLSAEEIAKIRKWIDDGAAYPEAGAAAAASVTGAGDDSAGGDATAASAAAIPGGDRAKIDAAARSLSARGVIVQPLALDSPLFDVNASRAEPPFGDADAAFVSHLAPLIANLNLAKTAIGDAGLGQIGSMPNLTHLRLDGTAVGDAGLSALGSLPKLESLNLVGSKATAASVAWIRSQPALKRVYVWQSGLDEPETIKGLAEGGRMQVVGADLPVAEPKTPPMPEDPPADPPAEQPAAPAP